MKKSRNKKLASTLLAMATLLGAKVAPPTAARDGGFVSDSKTKKSGPTWAKWAIGGGILGGIIITTEGIIRRKVLKNNSESKGNDLEALLEQKLIGDTSKTDKEWEKLPPNFKDKFLKNKQTVSIFAGDNEKLKLKNLNEKKEKEKQQKLNLEELKKVNEQNCKKIAECMGKDFFEKLKELYNKGLESFEIKVTQNMIYSKNKFVQSINLNDQNLNHLWNNVFYFFSGNSSITNIENINDNTLRIDFPGLDFNNEKFIEIKLTDLGLQLSAFSDTYKITAELKQKNSA